MKHDILLLSLMSLNYLLNQSTFSKIYTLESSVFGSHFNEIVLYNGNNYIFLLGFAHLIRYFFTCTKILTNLKGENLEEYNHDTLALLNNFNIWSV